MGFTLEFKQETLLKGFTLLKNNLSDKELGDIINFNPDLFYDLITDALQGKLLDYDKYTIFKDLIETSKYSIWYRVDNIEDELEVYKVAEFCTDFVCRFNKNEFNVLSDLFILWHNGTFNFEETYEEFLDNNWSVIGFNEEDLKYYSFSFVRHS